MNESAVIQSAFENRNRLSLIHWPIQPLSRAGLWSRSRRLGLETYQRLVSVSSREKSSTSRSRPFTSRAQDHALTVSWWACRWRRTQ